VEQFFRFRPKHKYKYSAGYEVKPECPVSIVTWFDAAAYCRWLSEREDLPEEEMCYPPVEQIRPGMVPYENYLDRTGYRLPTEAEWTEACRSGTRTRRYFGQSSALSPWYAWSQETAGGKLHPVGLLLPNELGLFDMMGNAIEWCQDGLPGDLGDPIAAGPVSSDHRRVLKGGWISSRAELLLTDGHNAELPTTLYNSIGFRVARTLRPPR
jgi:formylglycine-generating enzyme required for sulfatase activity